MPEFYDDTAPIYVISVAAQLSGMHPQTLRQYDRLGLVSPGRTGGRGRRYSLRDIAALREVQRLTADGVNLAGVKRILELEQQVSVLEHHLREVLREVARMRAYPHGTTGSLRGGEVVPWNSGAAALVVWRPEAT